MRSAGGTYRNLPLLLGLLVCVVVVEISLELRLDMLALCSNRVRAVLWYEFGLRHDW